MAKRTTLVDRRILTLLVQGIPELPEEAIERHLKNAAPLHWIEAAILRADLTKVNLDDLGRLLIRRFAPGVLDSVRGLGDQFAKARMIEVPGGETLESQRRNKVIEFRTKWYFEARVQTHLRVTPSLASQVVYLPGLVEDSLYCPYDEIDKKKILASLPQVQGLRWIVGNAATVCRVLATHLKETGECLLPEVYTWTTDEFNSPRFGLSHLIVGDFDSYVVSVQSQEPWGDGGWCGVLGLFVLGVPE